MSNMEDRLAALERQLRRTRLALGVIVGVLVLACTAAAAPALVKFVCKGLTVKSADGTKTVVELKESGDVDVGGTLKIKDLDVGATLRRQPRIIVGQTKPGEGWEKDPSANAIRIHVDTSLAGIKKGDDPLYFVSLRGDAYHFVMTGTTNIYPNPNGAGFMVALYNRDYDQDTLLRWAKEGKEGEKVVGGKWHINWMAVLKPQDAR